MSAPQRSRTTEERLDALENWRRDVGTQIRTIVSLSRIIQWLLAILGALILVYTFLTRAT